MANSQSTSLKGIESLPKDLITKILAYLPAKSVGKFRCVSKLWASTLSQKYFTDLFLTKSPSRPRFLFSLWPQIQGGPCKWSCVSSHQPHNPGENMSIQVDSRIGVGFGTAPASGLIFCTRNTDGYTKIMQSRIGNPTTGQYVELPILEKEINWREFLGYDPIGKQFKVLSMNEDHPGEKVAGHVLNFPCEENDGWRSIQCPTRHRPLSSGINI